MQYDSGEVLQGIDETWTFLGANALEWCVGLVVFLAIGSCARTPSSAMPLMMAGWISTTVTLASIRRHFPDEERGTRNAVMTVLGFAPPGIPKPASLQPRWSHAPIRKLHAKSKFVTLGLEQLFPSGIHELFDDEEF